MNTSEDEDTGNWHEPHIVGWPAAADLIPSNKLLHAFRVIQQVFFKLPLDELPWKHYIQVFSRRVIRGYFPPVLNMAKNVCRFTKQQDSSLSEMHKRLAQITRPLDLFMQDSLRLSATSDLWIMLPLLLTPYTLIYLVSHLMLLKCEWIIYVVHWIGCTTNSTQSTVYAYSYSTIWRYKKCSGLYRFVVRSTLCY